ncbi:hypothetical protein [Azospirillum largimobile]
MIRKIAFATLAAALLATPALAQPKTGAGTGMPSLMSVPGLVSTNVANATNVGAGIGNSAQQQGTVLQGGGAPIRGVGPLVSTNVGTATNVAAGIGNTAGQKLLGFQGNGVQVGLNFSGRGPLVSTNVGIGTNVTAGLGNSAAQSLTGLRR